MRVVKVVSEGMLQVRMRSRLQFTVEQELPCLTGKAIRLVNLEVAAPKPVAVQEIAPAAEKIEQIETPKKGVVVEWPSKLSATLRRMKAAIAPAASAEALNLFQSPTGHR